MADIQLTLGADGTSMDWADPSVLAQPVDNTTDLDTYILMLLGTDRVAPTFHYGLQPYQRRGSWHDSYVGEFGALFWLGVDMNQWAGGAKLPQIQRWAEQALETVYNEGFLLQPALVSVDWLTQESVQINITLIQNTGQQREIVYVLPS